MGLFRQKAGHAVDVVQVRILGDFMNKRVLVLAFIMIFVGPFSAFSQEKHPIDKFLEDCLDKNLTNAGMANCTYEARVLWDKEMNKYYDLLMKIFNKDEQMKLREAQRAWLKFRDAEFANIKEIYEGQGTMFIVIQAADRLEIVKQRAEALRVYYQIRRDN